METIQTAPVTQEKTVPGGQLTAEQVRQVAERVYAMLMMDLKLERERRREGPNGRIYGYRAILG